jgi:mRNA-degrading endonuclease RelE of RelBE toxin-antitoxin system
MNSGRYALLEIRTFSKNIKKYFRNDEDKIRAKIQEMLTINPYRYEFLKGKVIVSGLKLVGLRHMKVGIKGRHGGAVILYRICEECLEHKYYEKSDAQCDFCDEEVENQVVIFDTFPRSRGYR